MAALINSSLAGSRSGSVNVPSTPPSRTITPGFAPRTRYCDTAPVSTSRRLDELRCDADAAIIAPGIRSDQVRTPVVHTVNDDANAQILTRPVPGPRPAGLDRHRGGISRLELDPHHSPAQLSRRPHGVDHLQVVVWQQRRKERTPRPQHHAPPDRDSWQCAALSHQPTPTAAQTRQLLG